MTARDWRATAGCALALTGGALLLHDLWTGLTTGGGSNPYAERAPHPRLFPWISPADVRYVRWRL